ncbi:MAG: CapA family protein [Intestinibacter bartlettii]|uniref:CapA family protein n=1 Tax=Intestinibacter bartlettii TaxID=261299 RepID=UPI0026EB6E49|nr:CapA family protein [Intestinibacter bartlettii]MDO5009326.1 CapA family protein [Intestinibacter bartlettii]
MGSNKRKKKKTQNKKIKNLILIVAALLIIIVGFKVINKNNNNITEVNKTTELTKSQNTETYKASLLACGDVMAHSPQLDAQYNSSTKEYSFDNNYKYVKQYIQNADLAIANLETTLAGNDVYNYSSYPTFNTPDALADALKNAGFDLLSTINNHSFDMSSLGVERTLSTLKAKGFDTVGTRQKKSDNDYIIKNVNNIKLGITSYSYGEIKNGTKYLNGIKVSDEKNDLMNVFDSSDVDKAFNTIYSTVKKYKDNTDMQIVIIHWGNEYSRTPTEFQTKLAQKLCDAGVDIIIGSHPHVVEPVETIKSTDGKHETLVVYSLGNYISNQRREYLSMYTEDGLMVDIDIEKKGDNEATVKKVTCIPTWVTKYSSGGKDVYEIIPIADDILQKTTYIDSNYLKQSYKNTSELIKTDDKISVIDSPFNN